MPDDVCRCIRCGWQDANFASATPQTQEQPQAPAATKSPHSYRLRTLAAVLTSSLFFLVSCTGGFHIASAVTGAVEDRLEQTPIDEENPPRHSVAIVATSVGAPASGEARVIYWLVKDPECDLAEFRLRHPRYSFLPSSDKGYIFESLQETNVEYQVLKRESGKAIVKTHYHHYPMIFTFDVRATYEATDSAIRLISYRVDSDTVTGFFAGPVLALLLAVFGEVLWRRIVKSELQADHRDADLWDVALAEAGGNVHKAQSRYIAKRVKQLKRSAGESTKPDPSALAVRPAPTAQSPIPNVRKRLLLSTVAALGLNACAYAIATPGHTTAAGLIGAVSVPLIFAILLWAIVSLVRGAKFRSSWRVYEATLLVVAALRLLGFAIYAATH